ncbi:MAG: 2-dehydro-3-deoxygalactonokinase [Proteobacteria bacterium]|nr:2-dehydro-3-deoxygalactonokinase [Pseudomonadota bacterium]
MNLVAVDWGTSSLRGARLDEAGRVLEEKTTPQGILAVPAGQFPAVFESLFSDWMKAADSFCLISGMAGSRQGWAEAPYEACPADLSQLARRLHWIEEGRIAIVPGLSDEQGSVPDVMRGEEVQIFGAMRLTGMTTGLFVLPGTHNKWVTVRDGRITGFRTCMTGEFYAVLSQHSILGRTMQADAPLDEPAFLRGLAVADNGEGLLHNAFGARTLALFRRLSAPALASYLSGVLIGEELRARPLKDAQHVVLIGAPALTMRYALALETLGVGAQILGAEATWAGAHALHTVLQARSSA